MDAAKTLQDITRNSPMGQDKTLRKIWDILDDTRTEFQYQMERAGFDEKRIKQVQDAVEDDLARKWSY